MRRLAAKFGFVHRTLWQRGHAYRWAVLLGPPPVIGCAVAALFWAGVQHLPAFAAAAAPGSHAPWAHATRPVIQAGQPFSETAISPLPRSDATGRSVGLQPGWAGEIHPLTVDAMMDVTVAGLSLVSFTLDQAGVSLTRILDAGPPTGVFAGTARALFAARTGGLYAFSARLTRAGTQSATCMVRLGSAHHRILNNVVLNAAADAVMDFPPTEFRLEPGLFLVQLAVACWRGDRMAGPGELTLMVRHPGETALQPATAAEVMRPAPRPQGGIAVSAPAAH